MRMESRELRRAAATTLDLTFLHERAGSAAPPVSDTERHAAEAARRALLEADGVVARLGGRSGRLGECIVGTALLEGALQALRVAGKAGTPVRIVVDAGAIDLFDAAPYDAAYWPGFAVLSGVSGDADDGIERALATLAARNVLVLDLHGGHDGMPALRTEDCSGDGARDRDTDQRSVATLAALFRTGVRAYAERGPFRRYADFVEDLFGLPRGAIEGDSAQPMLRLSPGDGERFPAFARRLGLRPEVPLVVAFFQSVVAAKCYTRWDETLSLLCARLNDAAPGAQLDILIACGPGDTAAHPDFATRASLETTFGAFSSTRNNACVLVAAPLSLRDLALIVSRARLVLANDTGPGHIAGALGVPVITPYLPGNVYSKRVWASSLHHHGVTLDPSPFTFEETRDAVLWDSTHIIDSIPAEALAREAANHLLSRSAGD